MMDYKFLATFQEINEWIDEFESKGMYREIDGKVHL